MEKKPFIKPHLTFLQQVQMLRERGLNVEKEEDLLLFLQRVSYFRFIPFCRLFEEEPNTHIFKPETHFEKIQRHYLFDRALKLLVFDLIEEFEIGFRTCFSHEYSKTEDPNNYVDVPGNSIRSWWYEDKSIFRNVINYVKDFNTIIYEVDRAKNDPLIRHYGKTYNAPSTLPSWMIFEVVSMGTISRLFSNLKITQPKRNLTNFYGLPSPNILENWVFNIVFVRNICAHHGRLWNRSLKTLIFPEKIVEHQWLINTAISPNKLYSLLSALIYLQNRVSSTQRFIIQFKNLLKEAHKRDIRVIMDD